MTTRTLPASYLGHFLVRGKHEYHLFNFLNLWFFVNLFFLCHLSYFLRLLVLHFDNFRPAADLTPLDGLFFRLKPAPEQVPSDFDLLFFRVFIFHSF